MSPGWILMAAPRAPLSPRIVGWSSQRQPMANVANRIGPTCPSLSAYTNGNDQPASRTIHQRMSRDTGRHGHADEERDERQADPGPRRGRRAEQAEGEHERRERRRVVEQPEPAGLRVRHVVERLPGEHPRGGLVVGQEVEAEGVPGGGQGQPDAQQQRQHRDDGQGRATETDRGVGPHRPSARSSIRPLRRWSSGMRNRSQATRTASGIDARMREPRLSNQRMGTTATR